MSPPPWLSNLAIQLGGGINSEYTPLGGKGTRTTKNRLMETTYGWESNPGPPLCVVFLKRGMCCTAPIRWSKYTTALKYCFTPSEYVTTLVSL